MNAIVVTFDRLPLRFLGCYGNQGARTPNFDRLAAGSTLFEQHFAEHAGAADGPHAWTTGCYEFPRSDTRLSPPGNVFDALQQHGIATHRIVEADSSFEGVASRSFASDQTVTGSHGIDVEPSATPFAHLVEQASAKLRELRGQSGRPWLCWLHSRGVASPWIPPREFAEPYFADDGDDANENLARAVSAATDLQAGRGDRDTLDWKGLRRLCAAYVMLLDASLGKLLDAMAAVPDEDRLVIVAAAEGLEIGEPRSEAHPCPALAEEIVHTPLWVAAPGLEAGSRRQCVVQTADVAPTLLEWFGVSTETFAAEGKSLLPVVRGEKSELREYAAMGAADGCRAIRTSDAYLVVQPDDQSSEAGRRRSLFVKPEDLWETHDVAAQSPDLVDSLAATLADFDSEMQRSRPAEPPALRVPVVD